MFYNQAKSLAPTLKILLMFLCEATANHLQQSKGCCGVSYVLGFVQRSKPCTGIRATVSHVLGSRASEKGIAITKQVQLGIGVKVQL